MIDTGKPIRIYDDRSKVDYDLRAVKILKDGDSHFMCDTNERFDDECPYQPLLISKKNGQVLNSDYEFWIAENYNPNEDNMLVSAIVGYVSVAHPKTEIKELAKLKEELTNNMPSAEILKKLKKRSDTIDRGQIEHFVNNKDFDVRTCTLVAKALNEFL